jgi:protein O-mannosyl-transferase
MARRPSAGRVAPSAPVAPVAYKSLTVADLGGLVLLILVTLLAYLPALRGGLIKDDVQHITRPELRSLHGLWRTWFNLGSTSQYYPLLHTAFWVEYRLGAIRFSATTW